MGKGCANYPKNGKSFTATYLVATTLELKATDPTNRNNLETRSNEIVILSK